MPSAVPSVLPTVLPSAAPSGGDLAPSGLSTTLESTMCVNEATLVNIDGATKFPQNPIKISSQDGLVVTFLVLQVWQPQGVSVSSMYMRWEKD